MVFCYVGKLYTSESGVGLRYGRNLGNNAYSKVSTHVHLEVNAGVVKRQICGGHTDQTNKSYIHKFVQNRFIDFVYKPKILYCVKLDVLL